MTHNPDEDGELTPRQALYAALLNGEIPVAAFGLSPAQNATRALDAHEAQVISRVWAAVAALPTAEDGRSILATREDILNTVARASIDNRSALDTPARDAE